MAYELKEGKGSLFPNEKRESEKHPLMTGNGKWRGEEIQLAAWKTKSKSGKEYLSLTFQEPFNSGGGSYAKEKKSDIPF